MHNNNIGIAGLGWLGLPLAQKLQTLGFGVKGTVTQTEKTTYLQKKGIDAYTITLNETGIEGAIQRFLKGIDTLIVMIPPGLRRNTGADYVLKMTHFIEAIGKSQISNCIFISSTSVYGDNQGKVTEATTPQPDTEAGRQLLQVEQLFFNAGFTTAIVRFGGLIGGSRQPVRYLAGRTHLSNGNAPVNLIHRKDCIAILIEIIKQNAFGYIFNAVYPNHPSKAEYYPKKAINLGLIPPQYTLENEQEIYKEVHSVHLKTILDYQFKMEI